MRDEWKVLGRKIGTATGWDDGGEIGAFVLYDFEPYDGIPLLTGDVWFSMEDGLCKIYEDDKVIQSIDLVTALANIPRS